MMPEPTQKQELSSDGMARLLDAAFAEWAENRNDATDNRRTPRIALQSRPQVRMASYRIHGEEFVCDQTATLLDISADGLRITSSQAIPLQAIVCFDLATEASDKEFGRAIVVRCDRRDCMYEIGLRFSEDVSSLDVSTEMAARRPRWRIRERAAAAARSILTAVEHAVHLWTQRETSCATLTASCHNTTAWFLVEAKLTRYRATLIVDGRRVATKDGPLVDRIANLVSGAARPTMVCVSSHGFSGWAMIRPLAVTAHDLIVEGHITREAKRDATLTDMLTDGTGHADAGVQTREARSSQRATHTGCATTTRAAPVRE